MHPIRRQTLLVPMAVLAVVLLARPSSSSIAVAVSGPTLLVAHRGRTAGPTLIVEHRGRRTRDEGRSGEDERPGEVGRP
jgi:hypothetical protein